MLKYIKNKKASNKKRKKDDLKYIKAGGTKQNKEELLYFQQKFEEIFGYDNILYTNLIHKNSAIREDLIELYEKYNINFRLNFSLNSLDNKYHRFSLLDTFLVSSNINEVKELLTKKYFYKIISLYELYKRFKAPKFDWGNGNSKDLTDVAIECITTHLDIKDIINCEISVRNEFFKRSTNTTKEKVKKIINYFNKKNISYNIYYINKNNFNEKDFIKFIYN